jgi:hypothetical protein
MHTYNHKRTPRPFSNRHVGLSKEAYSASRWASLAPGEDDEVADFAASLLQPPATEDGAGAKDSGPMEPDATAPAAPRID